MVAATIAPAPPEVVDDRDAEGAALGGIGARAHLVEQHERRRAARSRVIATIAARWAEKVERFAAIDCSSPMSA